MEESTLLPFLMGTRSTSFNWKYMLCGMLTVCSLMVNEYMPSLIVISAFLAKPGPLLSFHTFSASLATHRCPVELS